MNKCIHSLGEVEKNSIGEDILFCELSDNWENISLGDCLRNCESQQVGQCNTCGSSNGELVLECQNSYSDNNTDIVAHDFSCDWWNCKK